MKPKTVRAKPAPIPAEWCTGHHFMDTVRLWFPDYRPQTLPTAAEQAAHRHRRQHRQLRAAGARADSVVARPGSNAAGEAHAQQRGRRDRGAAAAPGLAPAASYEEALAAEHRRLCEVRRTGVVQLTLVPGAGGVH